jgi:hypothetical protein
MKCSASHQYNSSLDDVYLYFRDAELIEKKYAAVGARNIRLIRNEDTDSGFVSETERELRANVPAMLSSILGEYNTVQQTEVWYSEEDGSLGCDLTIAIKGVPVSIKGRMHLHENEQGTVNDVNLEIKASVPLIGSALARYVAGDCEKGMFEEYEYIKADLAGE